MSEALRRMSTGIPSGPMLLDPETIESTGTKDFGEPAFYKSYDFGNDF